MNKLLLPILLVAMTGCTTSKDSTDDEPKYVEEAAARFGTAYECEPNAGGEYILCSYRPDTTATNPLPQVAFFVYDVANEAVALEEPEFAGDVKWVGDFELEMTIIPGIVREDGSGKPKYTIDVRSGDRRRVGSKTPIPK